MAVNSIIPPYPSFFEVDGTPLENGYIYVGMPGFEAKSTPKPAYFDFDMTISAGPYVRTNAGFPVYNGAAAMIYVDGDFSITVEDRNGVTLYTALNRTFAFGAAEAGGLPIQAPDGNFAATGFGFINEANSGFVRASAGVVQAVILGNVISQQSPGGTNFLQPVSGVGFVSGVAAAIDPDLQQLAAIPAVNGDMIARVSGAWVRVPKGAAGQVLRQNDALTAPVWGDAIVSDTSQATTSGTAFDFTGIPAWATRITVEFIGISMTGTDNILVQVGTSGGVVTTGYSAATGTIDGGSTATASSTSGMIVRAGDVAAAVSGHMTITKVTSTSWTSSHSVSRGAPTDAVSLGGGRVTPGGTVTRIRITRTGSDTFDAGAVNIKWE